MPHYDLDAIADEARNGYEDFTFAVAGEKFTLPSPADLEWRHRILLAQNAERGLKAIWGDEDYKRFVRAKPTVAAFDKLAEAYWQYLGMVPGEPSGSTAS